MIREIYFAEVMWEKNIIKACLFTRETSAKLISLKGIKMGKIMEENKWQNNAEP